MVWDRNVLKLGCDNGCTTIHIIKFVKLKKKKDHRRRLN